MNAHSPTNNVSTSDLLAALRQSATAAVQSPASVLHDVADAARALSGAEGTALALRSDGVIVCRARSGDIAPELGAPLNVESGISGECLRTGTILVCNDTASDERVDPEVCRRLGVRSIVVLPIRGRSGSAGILEAFSTRVCAFDGNQVLLLTRLAEIAEAAYQREWRAQGSLFAVPAAADKRRENETFKEPYSKRKYWSRGAFAIALLLISAVLWLMGRGHRSETSASKPPIHSPNISQNTSQDGALLAQPEPGISSSPSDPLEARDVLQKAAGIQRVQPKARPAKGATEIFRLTEKNRLRSDPRHRIQQPVPPPSIKVTASDNPEKLASLISGPATLPALESRISQGVTQANLAHRVDPTYPPWARIQRVTGSVTMDATIAKNGTLRDIKVISGPPLLVAAATEAVRQWRYSPALLNGTPVETQKRITIIFKLP
jgi:TonB family protein